MGDYLRSLATRTLSPPSVRPRARSLFEPAKSPFTGMQETNFPEVEQRIELRETPAPRIVTSRERGVEPRADRESVSTEAVATPVSQRHATPPAQGQAAAPTQFRNNAAGREEAQTPTPDRNLSPQTSVRREPLNLHREKEPKLVERTIERVDRIEKQTTLHSYETVKLAAETGRQAFDDPPRQRGAEAPREPVLPVRQSAPPILPVASSNAAAPEIHVSIGRVIVNAGASSVPRPQMAAAAPPTIRLTLDQYLRQRGGRS